MAQSKSSVVTPERFVSGFTYKDYIAQIKVNKDQFEKNYGTAQISAEDGEFFRKASQANNGLFKMLVIGEDWCPDVVRGMPVAARIAEVAGIELRVFPRDQNLDIMNEFLKDGQFMSVPVIVLYDRDLRHLGHWIERPKVVDGERAKVEAQVKKEMPNAGEQEIRTAVRERMAGLNPGFQQATVKEIRQMLAEKLGL